MNNQNTDIVFEKFNILECLKKDSGVTVYRAFHIYLNKTILLKTLDREKIQDQTLWKRFQREARTLAQLDHPNIIKVLDFGTFEHFFYISFEYFESDTLREYVSRSLKLNTTISLLVQIFEGMAYAHKHKIVHRDLKPENILVDSDFHVKIADFGLALSESEEKVTLDTSIVGTPGYMSPEQIRGEPPTVQSDIFSLGIIAYELFTGSHPFLEGDIAATINTILTKNVNCDHESIPETWRTVIRQMLNKSTDRIKSAEFILTMVQEKPRALKTHQNKQRSISRLFVALLSMIGALLLVIALFIPFNASRHSLPSENTTFLVGDTLSSIDKDSVEVEPEASVLYQEKTMISDTTTGLLSVADSIRNAPGALFIQCSPWAHVYIDSILIDTTPLRDGIPLEPGDHLIRLHHPNFPPYMKNIRIQAGEPHQISVNLDTLTAPIGYFACLIHPWGDVYIDTIFRGQTPFSEPLKVHAGEHSLVIKNQSYGAIEDMITIVSQETLQYRYNFETIANRQDTP